MSTCWKPGVAGEVLHVVVGDVDGHVEGVAGQVAAGVGAGVVEREVVEGEGAAGRLEVAAGVDLDACRCCR